MYDCKEYLDGTMTLDGQVTRISPDMLGEDFLKGDLKVSPTFDMQKMVVVDRLLFQILRFFRTVTGDVNRVLQIHFDDDEDTSFLYNDRVITGTRGFAALAPETAFNMFDEEYANHTAHVQCIQHMMTRRNNSFQLVLNSASVIRVAPNLYSEGYLSPDTTTSP